MDSEADPGQALAEFFASLRERRKPGLSLQQIVSKVQLDGSEVSKGYLSEIFAGRLPSESKALAIATVLGATDEELAEVRRLVVVARPVPHWWTRSGYIEKVRDIAPSGGLRDRGDELALMAAFCKGTEHYLWLQADPWAGKSALLSSFVLDPPPGTDVVSFFITGRLAAEADSSAFTDALLDQLTALTGEKLPASVSPLARDAHRRKLLRAAADKAAESGRRLILVVDGLDEDAGARPGTGLASVASLLPKDSHAALRVILASRPSVSLPADVPHDHPLRQCQPSPLSRSPHAAAIESQARLELSELLAERDPEHEELIGFIAACGGGLTTAELEELTGRRRFRLEHVLSGAFGRTVSALGGPLLFAHETLRKTAIETIGSGLAGFRARINEWADIYRERGWPGETPQYLIRGYPDMLRETADAERLVALATDPARHERLLAATHGDAAAMTEIRSAQDLLLESSQPDLVAMGRLSVYRNWLSVRNAAVPSHLPAVWARLGQPAHAEALVYGTPVEFRDDTLVALVSALTDTGEVARAEVACHDIHKPTDRAQALISLIPVVDDLDHAKRLVDEAKAILASSSDPWAPSLWSDLAVAVARRGSFAHAQAITRHLPDGQARAMAQADVLCAAGNLDTAVALDNIEACSLKAQAPVLLRLAQAAVIHNLGPTAVELIKALEAGISHSSDDSLAQEDTLIDAIAVALALDDRETATRLAERAENELRPNTDPFIWAKLADLVCACADLDSERARRLLATAESAASAPRSEQAIEDPFFEAMALSRLADGAARLGDLDRMHRLAGLARAAAAETGPRVRGFLQAGLAWRAALRGHLAEGTEIARQIADYRHRAEALTSVAQRMIDVGERALAAVLAAEAEGVVRSAESVQHAVWALAELIFVVTIAGDRARAHLLADEAERIVFSADAEERAEPCNELIHILVATESYDRAVAVANRAAERRALNALLSYLCMYDQVDYAADVAQGIGDPSDRDEALRSVAKHHKPSPAAGPTASRPAGRPDAKSEAGALVERTRVAAADPDHALLADLANRAEAAIEQVTDPWDRASLLTDLIRATVASKDHDRTTRLATAAEHRAGRIYKPERRWRILAELAGAIAAAGEHDLAESVALRIDDSYGQADAFTEAAVAVASLDDRPQGSDAMIRRWLAQALALGPWLVPLRALAHYVPEVSLAIADEYLRVRHRLVTDYHLERRDNWGYQGDENTRH